MRGTVLSIYAISKACTMSELERVPGLLERLAGCTLAAVLKARRQTDFGPVAAWFEARGE
jgi:hypothetical protein